MGRLNIGGMATGQITKSGAIPRLDYGLDANKNASPSPGDIYHATDLSAMYVCFTAGTWQRVFILPVSYFGKTFGWNDITIVAGSWTSSHSAAQTDWDDSWGVSSSAEMRTQSASGANNDELKVSNVLLNAGTYAIKVITLNASNAGILEVLHGVTSLGTSDLYSAGGAANTVNTFNYSPTARTLADLRFKATGKNVASTGWLLNISRIQIMKTA